MTAKINNIRNAAYKYIFSKDSQQLLPNHYLQRCQEFMSHDPMPVHWRPNPAKHRWNNNLKRRVHVQNVPVRVMFPQECNLGLWGGEGFVVGYRKKNDRRAERKPFIWRPQLSKHILYSEILDKRYEITVTLRTLNLIDDVYGFDHYILGTHEVDLNSQLGMRLKREMLLTLAFKTMYPDNAEKRDKILKKYDKYIVQKEEAEWVGLTPSEAIKKARELEAQKPVLDLKQMYTERLVKRLTEDDETEDGNVESWMSKLNPFASKTSEKS